MGRKNPSLRCQLSISIVHFRQMTSPLNSLSSQLVRRWKHIDPPGLWLSVFSGSAIVHLLVLGVTSRMAIESTATNPDLVAVDLVELPLENPPVTPIQPTPTPQTPTPPTIPTPQTPNPTPSTPNPPSVFPSGNLSNNPPTSEPTPQPTPTPEPTPQPTPTPEPTPQPTPQPNRPGDTPTDNSAGEGSEPTTVNSVSITLTSVTGTAAYENSCASSASQNFTLCPGRSISVVPPNGQCTGQFTISAFIDDSLSSSRGSILAINGVRRANGENLLEPCSPWLENLVLDWRFQPGGTSEYFTSALIDISIAIDDL